MAKRKQLNRRVVLVLGVIGVILVGVMIFLYIKRLPEDPSAYAQRATEAMAENPPDYAKAIAAYDEVIRRTEGVDAAKWNLAKADIALEQVKKSPLLSSTMRQKLISAAYQAMGEALRADSTFHPARQRRVDLVWRSLLARRGSAANTEWETFIEDLDRLLDSPEGKTDADLYYRRSVARAALAKTDEDYLEPAVADLRHAIELAPQNIRYLQELVLLLINNKEVDAARAAVLAGIEKNPKNADFRLLRAHVLRALRVLEDDPDEQAKLRTEELGAIRAALEVDPTSLRAQIAMADYLTRERQYGKAEELLVRARKEHPCNPDSYIRLSEVLRRLGKPSSEAVKVLREGLAQVNAATPEQLKADGTDGVSARGRLNLELANALLGELPAIEDPEARKKTVDEARSYYQAVKDMVPAGLSDASALAKQLRLVSAQLNLVDGKLEEALDDFKHCEQNLYVLTRRMAIHRQLGEPRLAEAIAVQLLRRGTGSRDIVFLKELVRLRAEQQNLTGARQALEAAEKIAPDDPDLRMLKMLLAGLEGADVEIPADREGDVYVQGLLTRAQILLRNGEPAKAEPLLKAVHERFPDNLRVLGLLVQCWLQQNRRAQALSYVRGLAAKDPENASLQQLVAQVAEQDPIKRMQLQLQTVDAVEDPLTRALQKYRIAANFGQAELAETYLAEAETIDAQNLMVLEIRFNEALRAGQYDQAQSVLEQVSEDQDTERQMMEVRLRIARGQLEQAAQQLEALLEKRGHLSAYRLLLGDVYLQMNKLEEAAQQYNRVVQGDQSNYKGILGLARVAQRRNDPDTYRRMLASAYRLAPQDPEVRERYLNLRLADNDREFVLAERQKIYEHSPDLNNAVQLARVLELTGKPKEALRVLEEVWNRSKSFQTRSMLAMELANTYRRTNQSSLADEKVFGPLLKAASTPDQKAMAYVQYGAFLQPEDAKAAESMYTKALEADPGSTVALSALGNLQADLANAAQLRGKPDVAKEHWTKSLDYARQAIEKASDPLAARKVLLRRQVEAGQAKEAVEGYKALQKEHPDDVELVLGMGLAYQAMGPEHESDALAAFNRAVQMAPQSGQAYAFRSSVYTSMGLLSQALADQKQATQYSDNALHWIQLAQLEETLGMTSQAAVTLRQAIARYPNYKQAYLQLLALYGRQANWPALENLVSEGVKRFGTDPTFPMAMRNMWRRRKQPAQASAWSAKALEIAPNNLGLRRAFLLDLLESGQYEALQQASEPVKDDWVVKAILAVAQARQTPGSREALNALLEALAKAEPGDVGFVGERISEAYGPAGVIQLTDPILKARPEDWRTRVLVGDAMFKEKKLDDAWNMYSDAMKLADTDGARAAVLNLLSSIAELKNDEKNRKDLYEKLLAIRPTDIRALNNLAYLLATSETYRDTPRALELINQAVRRRPEDPNIADTKAWILIQNGQLQEARDLLDRFADRLAGTEPLYHYAYVLEKTGDKTRALEYTRRALQSVPSGQDHPLLAPLREMQERLGGDGQ